MSSYVLQSYHDSPMQATFLQANCSPQSLVRKAPQVPMVWWGAGFLPSPGLWLDSPFPGWREAIVDLRLLELARELWVGVVQWVLAGRYAPSSPAHKTSRHRAHGNRSRAGLEFHFWPSLDGE